MSEKLEAWVERLISAVTVMSAFFICLGMLALFIMLAEHHPEGIAMVVSATLIAGAIAIRKPPKIYNLTVDAATPILQDILAMVRQAAEK